MPERVYLTLEDVLHIHADQIATYGGAPGVRDEGLVMSALLRPQTGYYDDLIAEAAALWESLTLNHGCVDGNKRVGFACVIVFLAVNGVDVDATEDAATAFIYQNLDAGTFRFSLLESWLRARAIPYASP
jgi:death-on-curing protein